MKSDRPLPTPLTLLAAAGFALVAFAANSVLCHLALGGGKIGAADFTVVRLLSGALMLLLLNRCRRVRRPASGSWSRTLPPSRSSQVQGSCSPSISSSRRELQLQPAAIIPK